MNTTTQISSLRPGNVFLWLAASWSAMILAFAVWGQWTDYNAVLDGARESARESFNKDIIYRRWAAMHGSMYVPITPETPPNPNLSDIPERDISTPSGTKLTLMNPAYMTRQVHELERKGSGSKGHLTSLNPIRSENAPDEWERRALQAFERGEKEVASIDPIGSEMYFRFMRPLAAEKECMQCHEKQGYKIGEIRGGISISLPWAPYRDEFWRHFPVHLITYVLIWIVGLFGLRFSAKQIQSHLSQRELAEKKTERGRALFQAVMDGAPSLIYAHDLDGRHIFVNRAFEQHFSVSHSALVGRTRAEGLAGVMPAEVAEKNHQVDMNVVESGRIFEFEESNVEADGTHVYRTLKHPLRDPTGRVFGVAGISTDITDRKRMEDEITQLAFNDSLTKLPNRRLLDDRLSQTIATSERSKRYGAVMFLDLDNFKPLNDLHGHGAGDLLLIQAADRLKACVREIDTVARFGGDEFVVMIGELNADKAESAAQASIIAEKIRSALSEPYPLTAKHQGMADTLVEHRCTASIGVALFLGNEASQVDILRWADGAMYKAKAAGRNVIWFHEAQI